MMKVKAGTVIAAAVLILTSFTNCPAEDSGHGFPEGCSGSGFEQRDNLLVLNTGSGPAQGFYLFNNTSGTDVLLNHPVKDPGASAGWASVLRPGMWSAFAVSEGDFAMSCSETGRNGVKDASCEKVLKACRFQNPVFKQGQGGSYWVSEDKTLGAVLEDVKSRGIRW